jgi:hypothetical protein
MKKLLVALCVVVSFVNCNNNGGGWSVQDRLEGMKLCTEGVGGKLDDATTKKYCSCVMEKAMQKYKSLAESNKASEEEGTMLGQSCLKVIQGGGTDPGDEGKIKKKDGLFGGGGWSKSDQENFMSPCSNSLVNKGYTSSQARQLCSCVLEKLEKQYSNLSEADTKGGEQAGATTMQECMTENQNLKDKN